MWSGVFCEHLLWTATCISRGIAKVDHRKNRVVKEVRLEVPEELDSEARVALGGWGLAMTQMGGLPSAENPDCYDISAGTDPFWGRYIHWAGIGRNSAYP